MHINIDEHVNRLTKTPDYSKQSKPIHNFIRELGLTPPTFGKYHY